MPIQNIKTQVAGLVGVSPNIVYIQTNDTQAQVLTVGYLNQAVQNGVSFPIPCLACVSTASVVGAAQDSAFYEVQHLGANWSLIAPMGVNALAWYDVTPTFTQLAATGKVVVQLSTGSQQYKVRNIIMNYGAAGLSGGGGNRLLSLTDGTTAFNNAGITAALLGTPINTVWGGTGNPLAGTVAQNTSSVAGSNIYLQYAGGTTDYTAGSVTVSVLVQRVN